MEAGILGMGDLRRWRFLASPNGARIYTSSPSTFLMCAVAASLSLCSFSLRPAPPRLFPPHISLTLTSAALNFLTRSSNFSLDTLTCSAGCLNCPTTRSRTWGVTPKKLHTPTQFYRMACCSWATGKAGGRTPKFSTLPRGRLLVMAALVCHATPRPGFNLATTATQSLLFLVQRCR